MSFNGRGITGNITFTEVLDPPSIRITTDLDGLRGEVESIVSLSLHTL